MLGNVADGFLGLFMFFTHWLSPAGSQGEIRVNAVEERATHTVIECVMVLQWNERMNDIIDAGIPLQFRITSYSDRGDTTVSVRTLVCDVGDYTYHISDSLVTPWRDSVYRSRPYTQIYRAQREFRQLSRSFTSGSSFHIEAVLLPSRAHHLNRSIDLSDICGCRKFSTRIVKKGAK